MTRGKERGKDPEWLGRAQFVIGIAGVVAEFAKVVFDSSAQDRLFYCFVFFVIWLLLVVFDVWGWWPRPDAWIPGLLAAIALSVFLAASLRRYGSVPASVPAWAVWLALIVLMFWCLWEIRDNVERVGNAFELRFTDSLYSILAAVLLLAAVTPAWFVLISP